MGGTDKSENQGGRKSIVWLGVVSLLNDLSSEVITRILPLFLVAVLNASYMSVGVVEAVSEATGILGRLAAGYFSDKFRKRKPFIFWGYALSVAVRPIIALGSVPVIVGARFVEKVGKSVRTAPRDALIADLSTESSRGSNFGIHRALDTTGAVAGLLAVAVFFQLKGGNDRDALRTIIIIASVAGVLALPVLWLFVHEAPRQAAEPKKMTLSVRALDSRLQKYLSIGFVLALSNSSDAFLIVRAKELGFSMATIFLILTGFNVTSISGILGFTRLSDKWGRKAVLILGWLLYGFCYLLFGMPHLTTLAFTFTMLLYGAFYSFTDGVEKAMVADLQESGHKGQGYGWLALVQGIGVVPANLLFAEVYQRAGARPAFWMSGSFALIGTLMLLFFKTGRKNPNG